MNDIIVDEIRRVRDELITRHGGIDGYFKYCQAEERALIHGSKARPRKQPGRPSPNTTRPRKSNSNRER
jgi:hypothetical protein